jgi:hypothetical protein
MDETHRAILEISIEDYTGLWEVVWHLKKRFTTLDETQLLRSAQSAARELLECGHVAVYQGSEFSGEQTALDAVEGLAALGVAANWVEPATPCRHLRLGGTLAGESAYYERE